MTDKTKKYTPPYATDEEIIEYVSHYPLLSQQVHQAYADEILSKRECLDMLDAYLPDYCEYRDETIQRLDKYVSILKERSGDATEDLQKDLIDLARHRTVKQIRRYAFDMNVSTPSRESLTQHISRYLSRPLQVKHRDISLNVLDLVPELTSLIRYYEISAQAWHSISRISKDEILMIEDDMKKAYAAFTSGECTIFVPKENRLGLKIVAVPTYPHGWIPSEIARSFRVDVPATLSLRKSMGVYAH